MLFALFEPSQWYWATAVGYALLLVFTLIAGGRGLFRGQLLLVSATGLLWSLVAARAFHWRAMPVAAVQSAIELACIGSWHLLLYRMLRGPYRQSMPEIARRFLIALWCVLLALMVLALGLVLTRQTNPLATGLLDGCVLAASLSCLALASQLHHDAPVESPAVLRMLVIAAGLTAIGQIFVMGTALLTGTVADGVLLGRVVVTLLAGVLLAQTVYHRPQWSLAIFVSPQAHAWVPRFMAVAMVMIVLIACVPWCRSLPASESRPLALLLITLAVLPITALLFSGRLSALVRVLLNKRFLAFRYNYRDQWLRLIDTLVSPEQRLPLPERAIKAVAQIVSSPGGLLWLRDDHDGQLACVAGWNARSWSEMRLPPDDPVIRFMDERQWIFDTAELARNPALYQGLVRPGWLDAFPDALLLVPLISNQTLIGFVLLLSSPTFRLTFEAIDLLRTSGRQVAAHLAQYQADQRLGEARQFEAFNRMAAFLMHDLKNLIAQQMLVVSNAARHKGNPAFFEDTIATIENSVARMSKLLQQFQSGEAGGRRSRVRLAVVIAEAVDKSRGRKPEPQLVEVDDGLYVCLDRERFVMIAAHLIRNAQEATAAGGRVGVRALRDDKHAVLTIEDDGCGMDAEFIRTRLFRPFDTTKGNKGMGIGAYQARMFVIDSGGTLEVKSVPGEGTSITIRLPLDTAEQSDGSHAQGRSA